MMLDDDETMNIVIDNGSCVCKMGFAGDDAPRCLSSSVVGRTRHAQVMVGLGNRDTYIGYMAQEKRGMLSLEYPIKRGVVTDWDTMEEFWKHMYYNELRAAPEEHPVLITEPPLNPKSNREKMIEIFFESLEVPAFYVTIPAILSCYASGRGSGIILDIGDSVSHVMPIYEGYTIPQVIDRINLGGQDITDYLGRLIQGRGYNLDTTAEHETVRELKEKVCYTAQDYFKELQDCECSSEKEVRYELPDGNMVTVESERFMASEVLFDPMLIGKDFPGVHEKLFSTLMKCDMDMRKDLYANLIISGGTTLLSGFAERLNTEMGKLIPTTMKTKVVAPPERSFSVWIGGSILASLSTFAPLWITSAEYEETGPVIVHQKCFHA
ncbi:uncharacterized protein LOC135461926 isoform X2 [Liolophura sinensis]|uniref:uncharacterized protein LOC135461926 isoform X2 n=1 Tax=Liolophura sinensis TaxID=3198878 RepID=UPI00315973FA